MFKWLKLMMGGKAALIRSMDDLEAPLCNVIRNAQNQAGAVDAESLSKKLVDSIQLRLCSWFDVDPKDILPKA